MRRNQTSSQNGTHPSLPRRRGSSHIQNWIHVFKEMKSRLKFKNKSKIRVFTKVGRTSTSQVTKELPKAIDYTKFIKRPGLLVSIFIGVFSAFFIQLIIANNLATRGGEIKELELKKADLLKDIQVLDDTSNQLRSISRIQKEAKDMGMSFQKDNFDYLPVGGPE